MELQEVRKIIRESSHTDYINNIVYEFSLPHLDISVTYVGIVNIYKFFKEQDISWKQKSLDIPNNQFDQSVSFFSTAYTYIASFIGQILTNTRYTENDIQNNFNSYMASYFTPNTYVFLAESTEVEFLIKLLGTDEQKFNGAYKYFTNQSLDYNSRKSVEGYMLAYEFNNRESSVLFNRREAEKRHVNEIRNKFLNIESEYQNEVISLVKKVEEDYKRNTILQDDTQHKSRKLLAEWLVFSRNNFSGFLGNTGEDFSKLLENSNKDIEGLKTQYGELLKLKEPVTYWKERAAELNKKANWILGITVGFSTLFAVLVYLLLWFTPEGLLDSLFGGDMYKAIRWSFVFVIFVSIYFVVVKALMKYMFSNYHLARDAEEREKLTYLYISLRDNSDVSEEEKKIVFQALFSRSDTGLLKEDSSPTMPGINSILEKKI